MKIINLITGILVLVGGLNWGLVGIANMDLVAMLLGKNTPLSRLVYGLVGASAGYQAAQLAIGLSNGDLDLS